MHKLFFCTVLSASAVTAMTAQSSRSVFVGEISDSQCANNVHSKSRSHKEMTVTHAMGATEADCVRACVRKMGGQYVLLTRDGKVLKLSDQKTPENFAGESVRVRGTLDPKSNTVEVESIEAISGKS